MATLGDIAELIPTLCGHDASAVACSCGENSAAHSGGHAGVTAAEFEALMLGMNDAEIHAIMQESAAVERQVALLRQIATGIASARSARAFGHGGLAAKRGHRSAVSLVQEILGVSQAEAARQVRVSESLVDATGTTGLPDAVVGVGEREPDTRSGGHDDGAGGANGDGSDDDGDGSGATGDEAGVSAVCQPRAWHEPLRVALRDQALSNAQFDTIRTGLGEPPRMPRDADGNPLPILVKKTAAPTCGECGAGDCGHSGGDAGGVCNHDRDGSSDLIGDTVMVEYTPTVEEADAFDAAAREAWSLAAEQLVVEARVRTIKDLLAHARFMRDQLDPEGAKRRFDERYEARSFRMFQTDTGATRVIWTLDDQTALLIAAAHDAALRPRRGGPRFVDSAEIERAAALAKDPRTNEQLASDLMTDIVRAGILADAKSVFGTRQAGVRLVQVIDDHGHRAPVAYTEDRLTVLPGGVADQHLCNSESIHATFDASGNPLNLGRSVRKFTAAQKTVLAIRDGGCRWPNCDRPASYTEAHHIDPWEEGGTTDIDRGILLCQYHHLNVHNNKWRITRQGKGDFTLTHPDHPPQPLPARAALEYAFQDIALPDPRFRQTSSPPTRESAAA
ncbi:HNH endonuclease signature motif containing protein [Microbacterium sp. NC79]|uniref:HNH endonuclease signature motif containing protein n=1 Tax=Microbacterium sp. NC79 TaxID=2851009 RepID=UPI001C2BBF80|nr:HNH endonuclease signature motif containing protein [Microbacterium sp. NC79]MBV0894082.1 HNH endonuclease [Microbacterium sp. NC79]